jgi:hypothetical protein
VVLCHPPGVCCALTSTARFTWGVCCALLAALKTTSWIHRHFRASFRPAESARPIALPSQRAFARKPFPFLSYAQALASSTGSSALCASALPGPVSPHLSCEPLAPLLTRELPGETLGLDRVMSAAGWHTSRESISSEAATEASDELSASQPFQRPPSTISSSSSSPTREVKAQPLTASALLVQYTLHAVETAPAVAAAPSPEARQWEQEPTSPTTSQQVQSRDRRQLAAHAQQAVGVRAR